MSEQIFLHLDHILGLLGDRAKHLDDRRYCINLQHEEELRVTNDDGHTATIIHRTGGGYDIYLYGCCAHPVHYTYGLYDALDFVLDTWGFPKEEATMVDMRQSFLNHVIYARNNIPKRQHLLGNGHVWFTDEDRVAHIAFVSKCHPAATIRYDGHSFGLSFNPASPDEPMQWANLTNALEYILKYWGYPSEEEYMDTQPVTADDHAGVTPNLPPNVIESLSFDVLGRITYVSLNRDCPINETLMCLVVGFVQRWNLQINTVGNTDEPHITLQERAQRLHELSQSEYWGASPKKETTPGINREAFFRR